MKKIAYILAFFAMLFLAMPTFAQVMTGTGYTLTLDSANSGGLYSEGGSYSMEDTLGEIGTGDSYGGIYTMRAGYQNVIESRYYISMTSPADVSLGSFPGLSGGQGDGFTTSTVTTNHPVGYTLKISILNPSTGGHAMSCSALPCDIGVDDISDYTPAVAGVPDYNWTLPDGGSNQSAFGFTAEGNDITTLFRDNGAGSCNTALGNDTANTCWYGLSTAETAIAYRNNENDPAGTPTTVRFRTASLPTGFVVEGQYQATVVLTALTN